MKEIRTDKPGSTKESVRLNLGEVLLLADELGEINVQLRKEGRRILDDILAGLHAQCTSDDAASGAQPESERHAFHAEIRELQASWLRVDSLVDDMLSSATGEISQFAAMAEARIRSCERAVTHRDART